MKHARALALIALCVSFGAATRPARAAETLDFLAYDDAPVRVLLEGPGSFELIRDARARDLVTSLVLTDTTSASRLTIRIGKTSQGDPGWLDFSSFRCDGPLGEIRAPACSFGGAGMQLPGGIRRVEISELRAELRVGPEGGRAVAPLSIRAGWINSGSSIVAPERSLDIVAEGVNGSVVTVAEVRRIRADQVTATIRAAGRIGLVDCSYAGGVLTAQKIGTIRVERRHREGGSMYDCVVAARRIGVVHVERSMNKTKLLAGTDLGADAALGGEGGNADVVSPGVLGPVTVGEDLTASILGAGYVPVNGVYGDGDDAIVGGAASRIGPVSVGGSFGGNSWIGAGRFGPIRVARSRIRPDGSYPFVTRTAP